MGFCTLVHSIVRITSLKSRYTFPLCGLKEERKCRPMQAELHPGWSDSQLHPWKWNSWPMFTISSFENTTVRLSLYFCHIHDCWDPMANSERSPGHAEKVYNRMSALWRHLQAWYWRSWCRQIEGQHVSRENKNMSLLLGRNWNFENVISHGLTL